MGQEPTAELEAFAKAGRPIIVPIIVEARDSSDGRDFEFKIVAWIALLLDPDFEASASNKHWTGTVVDCHSSSVGSTGASTQPPAEHRTWVITLVS